MRTIIFAAFCFALNTAHSQLSITAGTGINSLHLKSTPDYPDPSGVLDEAKKSWLACGRAEYQFGKHVFVYGGLGLINHNFSLQYSAGGVGDYPYFFENWGDTANHYNALYLSIPLGAGYSLPVNKHVALRFFGGVNFAAGIGGTLTQSIIAPYQCGDFSCIEPPPVTTQTKVHYGGENNPAKTYATLQGGAGVSLFKTVLISCTFNSRIKSFYHSSFAAEKLSLGQWQVGAEFYLYHGH